MHSGPTQRATSMGRTNAGGRPPRAYLFQIPHLGCMQQGHPPRVAARVHLRHEHQPITVRLLDPLSIKHTTNQTQRVATAQEQR
jgi:hypothetical protein